MNVLFYVSSVIAVVSTVLVITQTHAVHALLYLVVSLLALATVFFAFGAPFAAALEVIVYAGAILVLFVFVMMLLNVGVAAIQDRRWLQPRSWIGPAVLVIVLSAELAYALAQHQIPSAAVTTVTPQAVGCALFGPYLLGVELASFLLLAGLVGAYHLGRHDARRRAEKRVES